jgi:hypothetical protein
MADIITVIVKPGEAAQVHSMPNTYEALKEALGGIIEPVRLGCIIPGREIVAWVNEEGMLLGLPWNRMLPTGRPLAGTIVVTAEVPGDEGRVNTGLNGLEAMIVIRTFNDCKWLDCSPASFESFEDMTGHSPIQIVEFNDHGDDESRNAKGK